MGQAKNRKSEIEALKSGAINTAFFELIHKGLNANEDGAVAVYKMNFDEGDDAKVEAFFKYYKKLTGHTSMFVSEAAENLGARIHASMMKQMFGDEVRDAARVMNPSFWMNCIAVVDTPSGKKVLPLRVEAEGYDAYRPAYDDYITLTAIEAAICRSALAWCALTNYAAQHGEGPKKAVQTSPLSYTTQDEAFDFYWTAKYAASGNVYRVMD